MMSYISHLQSCHFLDVTDVASAKLAVCKVHIPNAAFVQRSTSHYSIVNCCCLTVAAVDAIQVAVIRTVSETDA